MQIVFNYDKHKSLLLHISGLKSHLIVYQYLLRVTQSPTSVHPVRAQYTVLEQDIVDSHSVV
jgi:hypothetical protein